MNGKYLVVDYIDNAYYEPEIELFSTNISESEMSETFGCDSYYLEETQDLIDIIEMIFDSGVYEYLPSMTAPSYRNLIRNIEEMSRDYFKNNVLENIRFLDKMNTKIGKHGYNRILFKEIYGIENVDNYGIFTQNLIPLNDFNLLLEQHETFKKRIIEKLPTNCKVALNSNELDKRQLEIERDILFFEREIEKDKERIKDCEKRIKDLKNELKEIEKLK